MLLSLFFVLRFNEETSRLSQSIFNKSEKRVEANAFTANFHDAALLFSMVIVKAAIINFHNLLFGRKMLNVILF
jgi:hypothetical protein